MEQEANSTSQNVSALEHNIKQKGEFSYYYAHGRKFEKPEEQNGKVIQGPGIITGGDPVLLDKSVKEVEVLKEPKKFTKYIFYDDEKFAYVKIDLPEDIKDLVTDECIECKLSEKTMDLRVNIPNSEPYYYTVKKLFKKINPNESASKVVKGKIVINLKKLNEDEDWDKLNA
jgi:hypothetical protein